MQIAFRGGGGGVAGRHMGTERGETVCTLDKAPWGRADHHSGRQTGAGGRKMTPFFLVTFSSVYDAIINMSHVRLAGRPGRGAHSPTGIE